MRIAVLILSGLFCLVSALPGLAAAPAGAAPALRYSAEESPVQPPPGQKPMPQGDAGTGAQPDLRAAPIGYSVQQVPLPPPAPRRAGVTPAPSSAPVPAGSPERVTVRGNRGYTLGAGDKVHVTVYGETDLTGDFEISGSGQLAFPLIGNIQAAGRTAPALGVELARRLAAGYLKDPRVAVEVSAYRPFYIVGEVNKPGEYPYVNGMTALNAIALGGGYTPHAADGVIYVRHEGEASETRERVDESTMIHPGDVVRVSESSFWGVMTFLQPMASVAGALRYGLP